jgi:hypothetical protein
MRKVMDGFCAKADQRTHQKFRRRGINFSQLNGNELATRAPIIIPQVSLSTSLHVNIKINWVLAVIFFDTIMKQ